VESGVLPPSTVDLNLLLEWPDRRPRRQWIFILVGSLCLHLLFFGVGLQIPGLLAERVRPPEPERVQRHIPLYLPRDIMTQREPNRGKVSKQIDLADLVPSQGAKPSPGGRASVRHFELPKQPKPVQQEPEASPRILPQAPPIEVARNTMPSVGSPNGLPAAAPAQPAPKPPDNPFQDIGDTAPLNPHPTLRPPSTAIDRPTEGTVHEANGQHLALSDDVDRRPGTPGAMDQAPAQHAAIELESDANGADFKAYLRTILTIVRANWRRVMPESARMGTLRGKTVVEFIIDRDGNIPKLVIADPSGSEPLDRAAVAGLSMSNKLPPLPPTYKGFQVRLAFTFAYNMPTQ
jgi:TonB family protein